MDRLLIKTQFQQSNCALNVLVSNKEDQKKINLTTIQKEAYLNKYSFSWETVACDKDLCNKIVNNKSLKWNIIILYFYSVILFRSHLLERYLCGSNNSLIKIWNLHMAPTRLRSVVQYWNVTTTAFTENKLESTIIFLHLLVYFILPKKL